MEDLWKDIHLSSLHENSSKTSSTTIFQDFLSPRGQPLSGSAVRFRDHDDDDDNYDEDDHRTSVSTNPSFEALLAKPSSSTTTTTTTTATWSRPINKRVSDSEDNYRKIDYSGSGDPRHKRRMKNIESAARSRARRQAYMNELESEIAQLMEENAKLREQQKKLVLCAPAEMPKKRTHNRSLTAPF